MQHAPRPRARAPAKPDAEAEKPEKLPQTRPAMPSGTVRARRLYPRYRKAKRTESQLEPAAPNPNAPEFKPRPRDAKRPDSPRADTKRSSTPPLPPPPPYQPAAPSTQSSPPSHSDSPGQSDVALQTMTHSQVISVSNPTPSSSPPSQSIDTSNVISSVPIPTVAPVSVALSASVSSTTPTPSGTPITATTATAAVPSVVPQPRPPPTPMRAPSVGQAGTFVSHAKPNISHSMPFTAIAAVPSATSTGLYMTQPSGEVFRHAVPVLHSAPQSHFVPSGPPTNSIPIHPPSFGPPSLAAHDLSMPAHVSAPLGQFPVAMGAEHMHDHVQDLMVQPPRQPFPMQRPPPEMATTRHINTSAAGPGSYPHPMHQTQLSLPQAGVAASQDGSVGKLPYRPPGAVMEMASPVNTGTAIPHRSDENTPPFVQSAVDMMGSMSMVSGMMHPPPGGLGFVRPAEQEDLREIRQLASSVKSGEDSGRGRPLICQDINNSNADTLRISRLPRGVTYDRLYSMVEPFGEVEDLAWTSSDPYVCEVTYRDPTAAHEAKHFLGDAMVGNDSEPPLKAELKSRDPGAQLFVGDLTPDVTEEMLEATFTELVGEPVSALLKRDPDSFSPIGYGFLSFKSESSANFALVAGHRIKVGNACVRVGRAERNTYLYVSDLSGGVSMDDVRQVFGKFGTLVEEDTAIVRRSYAFIRYKNRMSAEKAKRTLDKTDLKGRLSVRYAEAEPLKACVAVQFHSSVPRPPNSLRDLLTATFSKHGNCTVEIPRLQNGMWRKVAFVTFHGEPIAANLAALEAVQSIRFVSSLPVCCQFARELIPRLPSRGLNVEKMGGNNNMDKGGSSSGTERPLGRNLAARKLGPRRVTEPTGQESSGAFHGTAQSGGMETGARMHQGGLHQSNNGQEGSAADFVPVYVPISALQQPGSGMDGGMGGAVGGQATGDGGEGVNNFHFANRMIVPGGNNFNSFPPQVPDRMMRW